MLTSTVLQELLEVYGPCISTAGWDDWARHRKVLAAPFNESIMHFVWDESLRQAGAMIRSWTNEFQTEAGIKSVQRDTRTLSLNVLAATGFRKSYDFRSSAETPPEGEVSSYRDALQTVLDNAILIMIIPYKYLQGPFMPKKLVRVGDAARAFKKHMEKMLEDETISLSNNKPGSGGLMSAFVRALDVHEEEIIAKPNVKESKDGKKGLSIEEIFGNIFVINFAGHDTTANTLAFAILLLAGHPDVQTWLSEEITEVATNLMGDVPVEQWDYHGAFPRLKRCQAVMLETLRLYPSIMSLPKWTKGSAQTIKVADRIVVIPPGVGTSPHLLAVHTHPKYWTDPLTWKPSRWIIGSESGIFGEELWTPRANTYFPWSNGPQNCPGAKFSRVETVAVLACLLRSHRVAVKRKHGEGVDTARKRAIDCANDVNLEMLLRMRNADSVKLTCVRAWNKNTELL